ncbi:MAG: estB [Aeromicrobium sp.]|nr:estB [Aeromicrobium sp.]
MLDSLPPQHRRLVLVLTSALLLAAIVAAALVVVRSHDNRVGPVAQDKPGPVVLIPGYGGNTALLAPMVEALRAQHRLVTVFTPTQGESGDLRVQARLLKVLVNRALHNTGASSVDVVGYSAGGIIARLWVRDFGGAKVARRVLTISSPNHGTAQANITAITIGGACPASCVQMSKGSDLLRRLDAGDETPAGPRWITIRSSSDLVVTPTSSAMLTGALNLLVQTGCPAARTAHSGMPAHPYVLAALGSTLGSGPPKAPTDVPC